MTDIYDQEVKLRGKMIKFRKWKVKDKKKYLENINNIPVAREALIYDCLEDKRIALDEEELKYMIVQIRMASLSDPIQYSFVCGGCSNPYEYAANLKEIITLDGNGIGEISSGKTTFEMSHIQNKEFYQNLYLSSKTQDEKDLVDFMLHIKSFNGNDGFTFDTLSEFISEMDAMEFERIFIQWQILRTRVNNIAPVQCPHCGHEEWYEFDALPSFFPQSWGVK
jgi:hypothetical protein